MNISSGRTHAGRLRRPLALAMAGGAIVAALVAGTSMAAGTPASTAAVSPAQLQATVTEAIGTPVPASSLAPLIREALTRATAKPTAAQLATAVKCYKADTCAVGSGTITIGIADGFGDNTWRKFTRMSIILQALTYPQVGKIIYTNAHGVLATYLANIRTLTADGAKGIVAYDDFGPAAYPAYTAAQSAGAAVSTYVGPLDGAPVSAVTTRVQPDICVMGKTMAAAAKNATGAAHPRVALFAGTPGNPQDAGWSKCAVTAGVNSVFSANTNWTPAGAFSAASALISSGKPAQAILYSYSNPVPQIVKAYNSAHKKIPAVITWTEDNGTACTYKKKPFPLYWTNSLNWVSRVSVTVVVDKLGGKSVPAELVYPFPLIKAKASDCVPGKPADFPGTKSLVPDSLVSTVIAG
jgi:ABC-type sugar transport system substrate-binding protein